MLAIMTTGPGGGYLFAVPQTIQLSSQVASTVIGVLTGSEAKSAYSTVDLTSTPTNAPGPSNGNYNYLFDNGTSNGGAPPGGPQSCFTSPFTGSLSQSTNFGVPPLRIEFTLSTACGISPYTVTWTFGDGDVATQSTVNISQTIGSRWYDTFIYNHTYQSPNAYNAKATAVDHGNNQVSGAAAVYSSFVPSLFYSFYNESGLIKSGINGSSSAIGLVEECDKNIPTSVYTSDLSTFDTAFGLPNAQISYNLSPVHSTCKYDSASTPNYIWDEQETDLDIQWAHVAAPGAKLYVCLDTRDTIAGLEGCDTWFYQNHTTDNIQIVSNSWSFCAQGTGTNSTGAKFCVGQTDPYNQTWSAAKGAGMTLLSSTGDFFANSICGTANYPSSNPWGVAVGGTDVTGVSGSGSYGSETQYAPGYSGGDCYIHGRGGSYVQYPVQVGEMNGTSPYYGAPSWQNSSLYGTTSRFFPDVSADATYSSGVPIVSNGTWDIESGTSVAAPIWAGILDVLLQAKAFSGFAGPFLYSNTSASCFHLIRNMATGTRDGLGSTNVGCLS